MNLSRGRALGMLAKCFGDQIWSVETCRREGVPQAWIDDLADAFESGFQSDRQTIYVGKSVTNHYHGVRDIDLAIRLGRLLGVDVDQATDTDLHCRAAVQSIKDAVMEGE